MRENTRCEVDEPMSTPTLRTMISSSPSSDRPVLEKNTRPPWASSDITRVHQHASWPGMYPAMASRLVLEEATGQLRAHELRHHGALLVEVRLHPVFRAFRF